MGDRTTLWSRWKAFAQRAAEVQGNVVFFLLYYVAIVPMGFLRLGRSDPPKSTVRDGPAWVAHDARPPDLTSSRRQF